ASQAGEGSGSSITGTSSTCTSAEASSIVPASSESHWEQVQVTGSQHEGHESDTHVELPSIPASSLLPAVPLWLPPAEPLYPEAPPPPEAPFISSAGAPVAPVPPWVSSYASSAERLPQPRMKAARGRYRWQDLSLGCC